MAKKTYPTITAPRLNVRFGGVNLMPNDSYKSFEFIADEENILPKCVIRLSDPDGAFFRNYWGLGIGSKVEVAITESAQSQERLSGDAEKYSINLTNLAVGAVYSHEKSLTSGEGQLEVLCLHPWELFQDFSSRAYSGKANSEIIKNLVENSSSRGFAFEKIDSEIFKDTNEDGNIPRYKCGEGDLEFIIHKILPYTTVNNAPVCFFVDDKNNVHLESYQSMIEKDAKIIIIGGGEEDVTEDVRKKAVSMRGISFSSDLVAKIGDVNSEEFTKIIKQEVDFDDCSALSTYSGTLLPKVTTVESTSYVPISNEKMNTSKGTGKVYYRNHQMNDMIAVALNEQKTFNKLFRIEIRTTFCGHLISTGDNVEIKIPDEKNENHWMNGKWHIKAIKYVWNNKSNMPEMKLVLVRPTFKSKKSLFNPDDFYQIGAWTAK